MNLDQFCQNKFPYFKPLKKSSWSNGYLDIEYGYIDDQNNVEILGYYDFVETYSIFNYDQGLMIAIDQPKYGYFRLFSRLTKNQNSRLVWDLRRDSPSIIRACDIPCEKQ